MVRLTKPWTDEEKARLIKAIDSGASAARASAMFKRSIAGIRDQARRLGKRFPTVAEIRKSIIDLDRDKKVASSSVPMKKSSEQRQAAKAKRLAPK